MSTKCVLKTENPSKFPWTKIVVSVDIVGNESLEPRLRVLTCIKLVSNKSIYDANTYDRLRLVSLLYDEACKDAATNKTVSSAWAILAAASVLGCPIQSVYPPLEMGSWTKQLVSLNTIFEPLKVKSRDPIIILSQSRNLYA